MELVALSALAVIMATLVKKPSTVLVSSITFSPSTERTLTVGQSITYSITDPGSVPENNSITIAPNTSTDRTLNFEISDQEICSFNFDAIAGTVVIEGLAPGQTTFIATASSGITSSLDIIVESSDNGVLVTALNFNPVGPITLNPGQVLRFTLDGDSEVINTVSIVPEDATIRTIESEIGDEAVCTMVNDGTYIDLTGVAVGNTTLTVIAGDNSGTQNTLDIDVKEPYLTVMGEGPRTLVNGETLSLIENDSLTITVVDSKMTSVYPIISTSDLSITRNLLANTITINAISSGNDFLSITFGGVIFEFPVIITGGG